MGIAEQHAVTFAAGMACEGMIPMATIYSSFLQRGYDQVVHDVALQNLPGVWGGQALVSRVWVGRALQGRRGALQTPPCGR